MKKILCLLLAILMMLSLLTACGGKKETDDGGSTVQSGDVATDEVKKDEDTSNTEQEADVNSQFDWQIKDVKRPDDKIALKVVEEKVADSVDIKNKLADCRLNYNVEDVKAKLYKNDLIAEKYVLGLSYNEETYYEEYGDIGLQKRYHYNHAVVGVLKESAENSKYFNDFRVTYYGDTNVANGYYAISVSMDDVAVKKENQNAILEVLNDCMPQEVAYYLVFAQDDDGKMNDGKTLSDGKNLYVTFEDDNFVYYLKRELKFEKEKYSMTFTYGVLDEKFTNKYEFYTGDFKSKNDTMKYMPSEFFDAKFGNLNLTTEPSKFMDAYFKVASNEYVATQIRDGWYWLKQTVGDNGVSVYEVTVEPVGGDKDVALLICPYLDMNYQVVEKDGQVIDMYYTIDNQSVNIDDDADMTTSYKKILSSMTKQMKMFLGDDADLSQLSYENLKSSGETKKEGSTEVMINFKGTEQKVRVNVTFGQSIVDTWKGAFKLSISMF